MKPAATLTAFTVGITAVFGAAHTAGAAVPALTDLAPAVTAPHDTAPAAPPPTAGGSPPQHPDSAPTGDGHGR